MYKILKKQVFSPVTYLWEIEAPDLAKAARPGHFVIIRHREGGERIPLTIADFDAKKGTITLVVQAVGMTTKDMMNIPEGDYLMNLVGPLGIASHVEKLGTVIMVGGGLGIAPIFPQLRAFKEAGNKVISIVGFRNKDLVFWEDKFRQYSDEMYITTDDGSYGEKGLVSQPLQRLLEERKDEIKMVTAIGPGIMMRVCSDVTRPFNVKTIVSLNTIMVDGTGMCGSCRVSLGRDVKFVCVDGPDFDGHLVNWDELMQRMKRFQKEEILSSEHCELRKKGITA
jgi:glutamate synthase (NADPH) small chain